MGLFLAMQSFFLVNERNVEEHAKNKGNFQRIFRAGIMQRMLFQISP